jgi:hypothetical protein|tara:strand:+ start:51958 stop:52890 length:933 start_codon:yes stop_codon:yes gene_type:complete
MAKRTFRNILNRKEFDKLTTPEKIKLALEKEIFEIADNYPYKRDFSKLDFSIYNDEEFEFFEHYDVDDFGIMLNYSIPHEICDLLCLRISHTYKSHLLLKEIQFKLEAFNTQDQKLNFLNQEIKKSDPFNLPELIGDFDKGDLFLSPIQAIELISRNKNLLYDWLTDGIKYETNFEAYNTVNTFGDSYLKFIYCQYCFNEIKSIKKGQQSIETNPNEGELMHPDIFKKNGFKIFEKIHSKYKDKKHLVANYSFLFYAMTKDGLIHCSGIKFIEFLASYNVSIDKIDSRQSGKNNRMDYYNEIKSAIIAQQ